MANSACAKKLPPRNPSGDRARGHSAPATHCAARERSSLRRVHYAIRAKYARTRYGKRLHKRSSLNFLASSTYASVPLQAPAANHNSQISHRNTLVNIVYTGVTVQKVIIVFITGCVISEKEIRGLENYSKHQMNPNRPKSLQTTSDTGSVKKQDKQSTILINYVDR